MKLVPKPALVSAVAVVLIGSGRARADDWSGFFSGQWTLGGNWNDFSEPGPSEAANFTNLAPVANTFVNLDANRTVLSMTVTRAAGVANYLFTRSNSAVLTVTNRLSIISVSGQPNGVGFDGFRVNAGSVGVAGDSAMNLSGGAVVNSTGVAQVDGTAALNITSSTFAASSLNHFSTALTNVNSGGIVNANGVQLSNASRLTVNSGGALNLNGDGDVFGGTMTINAGGILNLTAGTLSAQGGAIQFNRTYALNAGRTLRAVAGGDISGTDFIDIAASGAGTMVIDGAGSSIVVGGAGSAITDWGAGGTATISFQNSGTGDFNAGVRIGNGGTARVNVNSSASLNVDQQLVVTGGSSINIGGGRLTSTGTTSISGGSTINLPAGTLAFLGNATLGANSTINQTGGTLIFGSSSTFTINGGTLNTTGVIQRLPAGMTMRVLGGGKFLNGGPVDIGNLEATGTLLVDGADSQFVAFGLSQWGRNAGNAATVTFSNGGVGSLLSLFMSDNGGASTLTLASNAQLNVASLQTGNSFSGSPLVRINISGGTLDSGLIADFRGGTTVSLSSGGLVLQNGGTFNLGATLNKTGGTLDIGPGKTLAFNGGVGSISGSYALPNGSTLRVANGGQFETTSFLDVANGLAGGALLVDGTNSRLVTAGTIASDWGLGAGNVATAAFTNNGVGTMTGLRMAVGNGASILNIASGGNLNVASLGTGGGTGVASVNISGGSLNSTGTAHFSSGTAVDVTGNGVLRLGGSSSFSSGATFNASSAAGLDLANNTALAFDGGVGTIASGILFLNNGKSLHVTGSTGRLTASGINITGGGTASLLVDNNARLVTTETGGNAAWGQGAGENVTITLSNGGAGTIGQQVQLGVGGNATLNVLSGASFTAPSIITTFAGGNAIINVNGGTLRTTGQSNVNGGATLNFAAGTVNIAGTLGVGIAGTGARVLLAPGADKILRVGGLDIPAANGGKVDLSDNQLILSYQGPTPINSIRGLIARGFNGGNWAGDGVTSSSAAAAPGTGLGYIDDAGPNAGAIIIRYTLLGDATLDRTVNISDFALLGANFNGTGTVWNRGDFNYDGMTNIGDFALLAANFNRTLAAPLPRGAVPEPAALPLLLAAGFVARRGRH